MQEQEENKPKCPYCSGINVEYFEDTSKKPGSLYKRWICLECEIRFETEFINSEYFYNAFKNSKGKKYLTFDEWREWAPIYYKKGVHSAKTKFINAVKKYQIITDDTKYQVIIEAIKKIK